MGLGLGEQRRAAAGRAAQQDAAHLGDTGRYGELRGDTGRYGEIRGDLGRAAQQDAAHLVGG